MDPDRKRKRRRRIKIVAVLVAVGIVVASVLYRPRRSIVIDVTGPPGREIQAIFVVDGREEVQMVQLPATFRHTARDISCRIAPSHGARDQEISVHIHTADGKYDAECTARGVKAGISCPHAFGLGPAGIWVGSMSQRELAAR